MSGRAEFDASNFYLPIRAIDPWGGTSEVTWDAYSLLPVSATDPVGNIVQSTNDYRVLAPRLVTDPNLNRSEVEFDALGMVVATAVMGKVGSTDGDVITDPTTTLEYDLLAFQDRGEPAFVKTRAKETHGPTDSETKFQESYAYSDGFGRVIQQKVQAEPGEAPLRDANGALQRDGGGNLVLGTVAQRWVGTGRTVFNNKGNPVKQYEPFFSSTSAYEPEEDLVDWGVTPIITYDSIDRVVRTDLPDGTFTKVEFDSWEQLTFDQNDTVLESDWFTHPDRGAPNPAGAEPTSPGPRSAWLSAQHANTPTKVLLDSFGRPFLSVAHNRTGTGGGAVDEYYRTRTVLDIEGNTLKIFDAKQHSKAAGNDALNTSGTYPTITQKLDVLGRRLVVDSPDAGKRVSIQDIGGKPLRSYNARGFTSRSEFDAAQRPTHAWVKPSNADEFLVARMSYGESLDSGPPPTSGTPSAAQALNLRGQVHLAFDTAGMVKTEEVDFKGNVLSASRRLTESYKPLPHPTISGATLPTNIDWDVLATITDPATLESTAAPLLALEPGTTNVEVFTTTTQYDALNRVVQSTTPDGSITTPTYNEANLLEESSVTLPASSGGGTTRVVFGLDYNARGQRLAASHNDTGTDAPAHVMTYTYDDETFRVIDIKTTRPSDNKLLQHLKYTYDAVGNITEVDDLADTDPVFSGTAPVSGKGVYRYDALHRLTYAEGREHPGQQPVASEPVAGALPHANDLQALVRYNEEYTYDERGNIMSVVHQGGANWTRLYDYLPGGNRLAGTSLPGDPPGTYSAAISYTLNDAGLHGSMTKMHSVHEMRWDFAERLQHVLKATNQDVYFTYDGTGQRLRKVYEHGDVEERIYLGGEEIYRKRSGSISATVDLERETLHVSDDTGRIAMVETKTTDTSPGATGVDVPRWRYQLSNHLQSASMELDEAGGVLSYEEYHPHGSTAFHTAKAGAEVSAKRYRYTGKERDEETGLYYHGARYYAPWLGRWTAADPLGMEEPGRPDLNLFAYVRGRPTVAIDPTGFEETQDEPRQSPRLREKAESDNKLTTNPNERSYFRNFPDNQKPGGLGPQKFRDLLQDDVRNALAESLGIKPEEVDERVVEVVLAQAALETDYGRALFNSNIGNERAGTEEPHVYVEGAYEDYKTKPAAEAALRNLGEGFGRVVESPRVSRRLQNLRKWSHGKEKQVLTRGEGASSTTGGGERTKSSVALGGSGVGGRENRLFRRNAA